MGLMDRSTVLMYLMRAIVMLVAIPVHEAAHAYVSAKLGDTTARDYGRLTLNPMAHFDLMGAICMVVAGVGWAKPVPANPSRFKNPKKGMALTAAAGPAANILLAFFSIILYKVIYYLAPNTAIWRFLLLLMNYMASINITLAVFNLLPIPPFDGSRIVNLVLPHHLYFKIMQYERYIFLGMFLLLILGVFDLPLAILRHWMWKFLGWCTGFVDHMLAGALFSTVAL